jgi:hypothetical protein
MEEQKKEHKVKLRLEDIKVDSFLTADENKETKAGGTNSWLYCTVIFGSCWHPCTEGASDCCQPL